MNANDVSGASEMSIMMPVDSAGIEEVSPRISKNSPRIELERRGDLLISRGKDVDTKRIGVE